MKPLQCKDIATKPILQFLLDLKRPASMQDGYDNSIRYAFNNETPLNLMRAKMQKLITAKLITGCTYGCRGDFEITQKGIDFLNI